MGVDAIASMDTAVPVSPAIGNNDERVLLFGRRLSNVKILHLCCLWSGVPLMVALVIGAGLIAGFLPPPHPYSGAEVIAQYYRDYNMQIKYGIALSFVFLLFNLTFGVALASQTRRIEGKTPLLTYFQVGSFTTGFAIFIVVWVAFLTAAYRPDRAATEIYLLHDFAWIMMATAYIPFSTWCFGYGLAILFDRKEDPIIPRGVGFFSIFVGISFIPDSLAVFFYSGPGSWESIFVFYIPFSTWFMWISASIWGTTKAILNDPNLEYDQDHRAINDRLPNPQT